MIGIIKYKKEVEFTENAVCPFCGYEHESFEWVDSGETECDKCGKIFRWKRECFVEYCTYGDPFVE